MNLIGFEYFNNECSQHTLCVDGFKYILFVVTNGLY